MMEFKRPKDAVQAIWNAVQGHSEHTPRAVIEAAFAAFPDDYVMTTKIINACARNRYIADGHFAAEKALLRFGRLPHIYVALAGLYERANPPDFQKAVEQLETALHCRGDDPITLTKLGHLLLKLGRPDEAERPFRSAIALEPENPFLYDCVGKCLVRSHRFEEAEEWYRAAAPRFPEDEVLHKRFCVSLIRNGHAEEALMIAERILSGPQAEGRDFAYTLKARALKIAHRVEEGLEELESGDAPPVDAGDCRLRAELLEHIGKDEDALFWMEQAETLGPLTREHHTLKAEIYYRLGYPESALEEIAGVLALQPDHGKTLLLKARIFLDRGDSFHAFKTAEKAIETLPTHSYALRLLGVTALLRGKPDVALQAAGKLLAYEPDSLYGHGIAGKAHLLLREPEAARRQIDALLAIDPKNPQGHQLMACVEIATGRHEEGLGRLYRLQEQGFDAHAFHFLHALATNGIGTHGYRLFYETACKLNVLNETDRRELALKPVQECVKVESRQAPVKQSVEDIVYGYAQSSIYRNPERILEPVDRTAYHVQYNKLAANVEGRDLGFAVDGGSGRRR